MRQTGTRPAVLVVDDEPRILSSMAALLEEDFSVVTSTDAQAALELLGDERIAVLLVDQRMPGLTGDEFLAKAKQLSQATRVLITGYADINALIRAVNRGQIYTYVAKPWEPVQLKVVVTQAAEHCLLEKEIMRERNLLRGLMDNIPDVIWFKDAKGRFTQVNHTTARFFGVDDPSHLIGKSASDYFRPEEAWEIDSEEQRIRLAGAATNRIHKLHWNDGMARWMSTTKAPIFGRNGEITSLVGVSRDVTQQKQAELALYESEQRYRQIVETTVEGVWIFDEHLRTVFANRKMAAMLGCNPEEMERRAIADFLAEDDQELQIELFKRHHFDASAPWPADLRLKTKDGGVIWTIAVSSPMLDSSGRHTGTLAMLTDITERKALEEQFRQAQKLEAVGRFAGGVAHDFNNVLTVIMGHSQLLLRRLEAESPLRSQLEKIEAAANQAANLTRQLLTFSRRRITKPEVMDLNAAVFNFQKLCLPIIGEDVELITKLDARLGRVRADAGQLDQVMMNLAVNARDAMPQGGQLMIETANVELDSTSAVLQGGKRAGPYVLLEVRDTGCGMDAETQNRVFEPFFTTKEEGKGTGLGLSTVHGIVCQHDGWIEVKSELGHGTCFRIYLPQVNGEAEAAKPPEPSTDWPRGTETILVVEDRAPLRELVRESLTSFGYRVLEAGDGHEGLEVLERREKRIDLVVTDLVMPRMNGREFAKLVKERCPEARLLYMSGYGGDNPAAEVLDKAELLQKPFTTKALLQKVRAVIDARPAPPQQSVLVVDDEDEIRDLLRRILEEEGYRVLTAENGKAAVALLKTEPVKLMMTDLAMPEQEGMETIALVRKDYPDLQIIAMSGVFEQSVLSAAKHLGAHTIMEKPVQVDEVVNLVRNLLKE